MELNLKKHQVRADPSKGNKTSSKGSVFVSCKEIYKNNKDKGDYATINFASGESNFVIEFL